MRMMSSLNTTSHVVKDEYGSYLTDPTHEVFNDQGHTAPWYHNVGEFNDNIDTVRFIRRYCTMGHAKCMQ